MTFENDGRFPDGSWVLTCYPVRSMNPEVPRGSWPWWVAEVVEQGGPDEWVLMIWGAGLAELEDGSPAPAGTAGGDAYYPLAFRDASEIRAVADDQAEAVRERGGMWDGEMTAATPPLAAG